MPEKKHFPTEAVCPCGSNADYDICCGHFLSGQGSPLTAEQLMRSRYTAYVRCDGPYLLGTWHAKTRPVEISFNAKQRWLGLRVCSTEAGGANDVNGIVEYIARYKVDGKGYRIHEICRFMKIGHSWQYFDGRHG